MGPQNAGSARVRAWVLVQAEPVQGVAARIRNLDPKTTDDLVVIRADVVAEALPYNIVVPVDAESETVLDRLLNDIRGLTNVSEAVALKVLEHDPKPPHEASGFITPDEARRPVTTRARPGRQDASPGFNPWG